MTIKTIAFTLNGVPIEVSAHPDELLVDILRNKLQLTGTKIGCRSGDCGACTVIIDGQAVNSCMTLMGKVAGRQVQTIEGVAEGENLHPIQQAMLDNGAVQCGYCVPGMVMSAKALLDTNPDPSENEISTALSGNICRCTGYIKFNEAVAAAAHACQCELEGRTKGCQKGDAS